MGLTTDPNDGCIQLIRPDGQQECYLVLSPQERAKEWVRPLRHSYKHLTCGSVTRMATGIAETYARNPKFYGGTFCVACGGHYSLKGYDSPAPILDKVGGWGYFFAWLDDKTKELDGSYVGE